MDHLVTRSVVSQPICKGDLGLSNLVKRNKALRKWLWRFPLEVNSFCHGVIKSKYGMHESG